ncbi:uncharacterized protein LJ206_018829 isoform 2-T2 [Theristicus caerulescens]
MPYAYLPINEPPAEAAREDSPRSCRPVGAPQSRTRRQRLASRPALLLALCHGYDTTLVRQPASGSRKTLRPSAQGKRALSLLLTVPSKLRLAPEEPRGVWTFFPSSLLDGAMHPSLSLRSPGDVTRGGDGQHRPPAPRFSFASEPSLGSKPSHEAVSGPQRRAGEGQGGPGREPGPSIWPSDLPNARERDASQRRDGSRAALGRSVQALPLVMMSLREDRFLERAISCRC